MRKAALLFVCCSHGLVAQDTLKLSLLFVGDIMQHESQMKSAFDEQTEKYIYTKTFERVKPMVEAADIAIANLEFTLGGKPYAGYPQFSAPDEILPAIKDAGFDVLVTANNHSVDRGRKGIERTLDLLDSIGLEHTGTFRDTLDYLNQYPLVLNRNGISFSLLNYTYGTNGIPARYPNIVNLIDTMRIQRDLQKAAAQKTDAVIVVFHWGVEYIQTPGKAQEEAAAFCLRHGAKIVVGSHPHVIQPMVWDRTTDQVVIYSLGNFVSGQRPRYRNGGAMSHLDLRKVKRADGSSSTWVSDVSYSLVYVNRMTDPKRTFELIPITLGPDSTLVQGSVSRGMLREFINDSRSFLDRENNGVDERVRRPKGN